MQHGRWSISPLLFENFHKSLSELSMENHFLSISCLPFSRIVSQWSSILHLGSCIWVEKVVVGRELEKSSKCLRNDHGRLMKLNTMAGTWVKPELYEAEHKMYQIQDSWKPNVCFCGHIWKGGYKFCLIFIKYLIGLFLPLCIWGWMYSKWICI